MQHIHPVARKSLLVHSLLPGCVSGLSPIQGLFLSTLTLMEINYHKVKLYEQVKENKN